MLIIDGLIIDAEVISELSLENEVTDHPVEVGADVTDHSRPLPAMVEIEGVVSDTPLGTLRTTREGTVPSQDALAILTAIRDAREPVTLVTSLRSYNLTGPDAMPMQLKRLSVTRDARTGKALRFRATFKQMTVVSNQRTIKRVAVPKAKSKVNKGSKPTAAVAVMPAKRPEVDPNRPPVRGVKLADGTTAPTGRLYVKSGTWFRLPAGGV